MNILITGASSGIGRETAIRLAKEGYKVFAGVRRKIDKEEIETLHYNIVGVYLDVTNPLSLDKAFWYVLKQTEKIDVLIKTRALFVPSYDNSESVMNDFVANYMRKKSKNAK